MWRQGPRPVAVCLSDIHLTERPPVARSAEPDWLAAQKRVLDEVDRVSHTVGLNTRPMADLGRLPVIIAGDVFDRWNPSPLLLNWTIENLPRCWAVPGQHDLRHHSYEDIEATGYWNLVLADVIQNVDPTCVSPVEVKEGSLVLHGFPWGHDLEPYSGGEPHFDEMNVAVVHHYVWDIGHGHPGASRDDAADRIQEKLAGYDAIIAGDNHKGFQTGRLFNCGTLLRRKADEINYRPQVGILRADGSVVPYRLDTSQDKFADPDLVTRILKDQGAGLDAAEFVEDLEQLGEAGVDFVEAVLGMMRKHDLAAGVRRRVLEALGK